MDSSTKKTILKNFEKKASFSRAPNKRKFTKPAKQKDLLKQSLLCQKGGRKTPATMFLELTAPHEILKDRFNGKGAFDTGCHLNSLKGEHNSGQKPPSVSNRNRARRKSKTPRLSSTFDLEEKFKKVLRLSYDIDRYSRKYLERSVLGGTPMPFGQVGYNWLNENANAERHTAVRDTSSQNASTIVANILQEETTVSQSSAMRLKLGRSTRPPDEQKDTALEGYIYLDSMEFGAKCSRIFGSYKDSVRSGEISPSYSLVSIPAATEVPKQCFSGSGILRVETSNNQVFDSENEILNEKFANKINYEFCKDSDNESQQLSYKSPSLELLRDFRNVFETHLLSEALDGSCCLVDNEDMVLLQKLIDADSRYHYLKGEERHVLEKFACETTNHLGQSRSGKLKNKECKFYNISGESEQSYSKPLVCSGDELDLQIEANELSQPDQPESTRILYFNSRKSFTNSSSNLDTGRSSLADKSIKSFDPDECLKVKCEGGGEKPPQASTLTTDNKSCLEPNMKQKMDVKVGEETCGEPLFFPVNFEYYSYVETYAYYVSIVQWKLDVQHQIQEFEKRVLPFVELAHIGDFYRPLNTSSKVCMVKVDFDGIKCNPDKVLDVLKIPQKAGVENSKTEILGEAEKERYGKLSPWRSIVPFNIPVTASQDLLEISSPQDPSLDRGFLVKDVSKKEDQIHPSQDADIFGEGDSYFTDSTVNILRNNHKNFLGPIMNADKQKTPSALPTVDQYTCSPSMDSGDTLSSKSPGRKNVDKCGRKTPQKLTNSWHISIYNSILDKIYNVEIIKAGLVFIVHVFVFVVMVLLLSLPDSWCID